MMNPSAICRALTRAALFRRWAPTVLLLFTAVAWGQSSRHSTAGLYEIVELPLRPAAISDSDWVAGTTADQHAATWNAKSGLFRIPLPREFSFSECASVNSAGDAVGTASTGDYSRRVAFMLAQNIVSLLPGEQSRANSINEGGSIAGQTIVPGSKVATPVIWRDRSISDLHVCCAGMARSINRKNLIAGDTYDSQGRYHAFLWDSAQGVKLLTSPGEEYSSALALNNRGEVLLKVTPGGLFLYSEGRRHAIDIPKATPRAMNDAGVIVGSFGSNPDAQRAFMWDKEHGMRDLNGLIAASDWTLETASSINERGEIVGWGDHAGKENAGFLLRLRRAEKPR